MVDRIDLGAAPDSGTGESLRSAFAKVNANFAELAAALARLSAATAGGAGAPGAWPGEWVARHLADAPPKGAPPLLGALWVDTRARKVWISVGTESEADWRALALDGKAG